MNIAVIKKNKDLSLEQKWAILAFSIQYYNNEKKRLVDGSLQLIKDRFDYGETTIRNVLKEYFDQIANDVIFPTLKPSDRKDCGPDSEFTEQLRENLIDIHNMTKGKKTDRELVIIYDKEFGVLIPYTSMVRYMKLLGSTWMSTYLKPKLTTQQMINRLEFLIGKVQHHGNGIYSFIDETNTIHVDEKWFYVCKNKNKVRKIAGDDKPEASTTRHKSHIEKIMFAAAIACPRWVTKEDGSEFFFNGKIGVFAFVEYRPAQRASALRPAGTLIMESLSVTAETYLDIHVKENGILDMVKHKMPWLKEDEIRIRHDGAPGHTGHGNEELLFQAGQDDGWNIIFEKQPSQSPDLNKNDLCFFNSLQTQAEKLKEESHSKEVLLQAVIKAYNDYDPMILNRFDALQYAVYREILKDGGNNQ